MGTIHRARIAADAGNTTGVATAVLALLSAGTLAALGLVSAGGIVGGAGPGFLSPGAPARSARPPPWSSPPRRPSPPARRPATAPGPARASRSDAAQNGSSSGVFGVGLGRTPTVGSLATRRRLALRQCRPRHPRADTGTRRDDARTGRCRPGGPRRPGGPGARRRAQPGRGAALRARPTLPAVVLGHKLGLDDRGHHLPRPPAVKPTPEPRPAPGSHVPPAPEPKAPKAEKAKPPAPPAPEPARPTTTSPRSMTAGMTARPATTDAATTDAATTDAATTDAATTDAATTDAGPTHLRPHVPRRPSPRPPRLRHRPPPSPAATTGRLLPGTTTGATRAPTVAAPAQPPPAPRVERRDRPAPHGTCPRTRACTRPREGPCASLPAPVPPSADRAGTDPGTEPRD